MSLNVSLAILLEAGKLKDSGANNTQVRAFLEDKGWSEIKFADEDVGAPGIEPSTKEKKMSKYVHVRFPMSEDIWNTVVVNSLGKGEEPYVLEERTHDFDVEYASIEKWTAALNRFQGLVEHEVLEIEQ